MALTTEDLGQIKTVVFDVVNGAVNDVVKNVVKSEIRASEARMIKRMDDGFAQVIATIDGHIIETDRRFMSDRKRLERLEKIVL